MNKRTRSAFSGYTLVEVMLSVSVMAVGAMGFVKLQAASSSAVMMAHESSVALAFQETWIDRVRRDAWLWRQPGAAGLATTKYLGQSLGDWFVPQPTDPKESAGADYAGLDTQVADDMRYCVNLKNTAANRFNPIGAGGIACSGTDLSAIRVDVRVWWYRTSGSQDLNDRTIAGMNANACQVIPSEDDLKTHRLLLSVNSVYVRGKF
jgi:prepilin-type N-terminal cleavage/methylation domain-containing protein